MLGLLFTNLDMHLDFGMNKLVMIVIIILKFLLKKQAIL